MTAPKAPRPPKQGRSQRTLDRIVAAAEALLAEEGVDATTVKAVMERSGVGPGSFYARFGGREALLGYLRDRFWDGIRDSWTVFAEEEAWGEADLTTLAGEVVRRLVRGYGRHEGRIRASLVHALRRPGGEAMEETVSVDELVMARLTELFTRHDLQEPRVRVALLQVHSALQVLVLFPDSTPLPAGYSDEDLILQLTQNLLLALGAEGGTSTYAELLGRSASVYRQG